jgi:membrane protein
MEVALNRAWGPTKNRSYVKNQALSPGLILLCGGLVLSSFLLTALNQEFLKSSLHMHFLSSWIPWAIFKVAAIPMTVLALFLVYWLLPNCEVPPWGVVFPAVVVGLSLEVLKCVNILGWPFLKLKLTREYGPFYMSVAIILYSFVSAMMVLAAAHWVAWTAKAREAQHSSALGDLTLEDDEKLGSYRSG